MYDKAYTEIWIQNHESGKDIFRVQYLEPYFREKFQNIMNVSLLDVGCGWGSLLDFLHREVSYYGVDIAVDFFQYIRKKFPDRDMKLFYGTLPDNIHLPNDTFDICVCSQVLHTVPDFTDSITTLFSYVKPGGECILITFRDVSKEPLIQSFASIETLDDTHIVGQAILPSGLMIHSEIYFHREEDYERELSKYGSFQKKQLGPLFVAYECKKT